MIGIAGIARADMAETVEHAEIGEDAAAHHDILKQGGIGAQAGNEAGARDLIAFLTSPDTNAAKWKHVMDPPRRAG